MVAIFLSLLTAALKQAQASQDYLLAQDFVRDKNREFAFMYFLSVLRDDANPGHRQEALFAAAEYYFLAADYVDSFNTLNEFLENYPHSELKILALFYLLKISESWELPELSKIIEKQITGLKRVVLVFKENQERNFISPLGLKYKIIYYIDKLEFYIDGKLQKEIFY